MSVVATAARFPARRRSAVAGALRRNLGLSAGIASLALMILAAFLAPLPHDPLSPNINAILQAPSGRFWFGTDNVGFDVFSRTIASARRDIPLALIGAMASVIVGVPLGLVAAAGRWGEAVMRVIDAVQALPTTILVIVIVALAGNSVQNIILALAIVNVPKFARLVRGEAISLREMRFVEAAIAIGCSPTRVMVNHVLRNAYGIVLVQSSLAVANAIVVIATLSFLGLGASPPQPSWGSMIQSGARSIAQGQWWISVFPGLAVFIAVMSFNLIADGLERLFDANSR